MSDTPDSGDNRQERIIVLVPAEAGSLEQVARALEAAEINIESLDGRNIGELGVITLGTSDDDGAMRALLDDGLRAISTDSIIFHLPDQPGALAGVAERFRQHHLNVRTIHILHRVAGEAVVAVTTDDDALARSLLAPESLL